MRYVFPLPVRIKLRDLLQRLGLRYWRTRHGWMIGLRKTQIFVRHDSADAHAEHGERGAGWLTYRCNICGQTAETRLAEMGREDISCWHCGSTVRFRAVVHALSLALFGESLPLPDFPERPLRGLGLSDWEGYARRLEEKLAYENTFYHREPRLDITKIHPALVGTLDFLIASDVFEHVPPPVSVAFENAYRLLKPGEPSPRNADIPSAPKVHERSGAEVHERSGAEVHERSGAEVHERSGAGLRGENMPLGGVFIFTAPFTTTGRTVEHFPELFDYQIIQRNGQPVLENVTRSGAVEHFEDLHFHGGPGSSLEMRRFSKPSLIDALTEAGFSEVKVCREPCFDYGIVWLAGDSFPIIARK